MWPRARCGIIRLCTRVLDHVVDALQSSARRARRADSGDCIVDSHAESLAPLGYESGADFAASLWVSPQLPRSSATSNLDALRDDADQAGARDSILLLLAVDQLSQSLRRPSERKSFGPTLTDAPVRPLWYHTPLHKSARSCGRCAAVRRATCLTREFSRLLCRFPGGIAHGTRV